MKPYIVDLIVLVIILFEFLMGLRRGLSGELFRLFGTGLILAIGLGFYEDFGLTIANHSRLTQNQEMAMALAFLLIMVGMGICFFLLRIIFTLLVNVKFNDAFDRPAGGAAGILRGGLMAVLLLFAAGLWPNEQLRPLITVDSYVGKTVSKFAPVVKEKIRSWQILSTPSQEAGTRNSGEFRKDSPGVVPPPPEPASPSSTREHRPGRRLIKQDPKAEP